MKTWSRKKIKKEIKVFQEFNKNEGTTNPNLWETIKAMLREKFIAISTCINNVGKAHTIELTTQLKALEKKNRSRFIQEV